MLSKMASVNALQSRSSQHRSKTMPPMPPQKWSSVRAWDEMLKRFKDATHGEENEESFQDQLSSESVRRGIKQPSVEFTFGISQIA